MKTNKKTQKNKIQSKNVKVAVKAVGTATIKKPNTPEFKQALAKEHEAGKLEGIQEANTKASIIVNNINEGHKKKVELLNLEITNLKEKLEAHESSDDFNKGQRDIVAKVSQIITHTTVLIVHKDGLFKNEKAYKPYNVIDMQVFKDIKNQVEKNGEHKKEMA